MTLPDRIAALHEWRQKLRQNRGEALHLADAALSELDRIAAERVTDHPDLHARLAELRQRSGEMGGPGYLWSRVVADYDALAAELLDAERLAQQGDTNDKS